MHLGRAFLAVVQSKIGESCPARICKLGHPVFPPKATLGVMIDSFTLFVFVVHYPGIIMEVENHRCSWRSMEIPRGEFPLQRYSRECI